MTKKLPRLWVAADVSKQEEFDRLSIELAGLDCGIKVGLEAYTALGNGLVRSITGKGVPVFLDLKFHDIPNTVEKACANAAELGAGLTNIHALGGPKMIASARKGLETAGVLRPKLLAVTILTSHSSDELRSIGLSGSPAELVRSLAMMAKDSGADGIVCSPRESGMVRDATGKEFLIVTPGIRPAGADLNDQQRVTTPFEAIRNGSTHLVVGRPITDVPDRRATAQSIISEIESALR